MLFPEGMVDLVRIFFWVVTGILSAWQLYRFWGAFERKSKLSFVPTMGIVLVLTSWGIAHFHLKHQDRNNRRKAVEYAAKCQRENKMENRKRNPFQLSPGFIDRVFDTPGDRPRLHYGPYTESIQALYKNNGTTFTIEFFSWDGELFRYDSEKGSWSPAL
jgi:hypothetical protein